MARVQALLALTSAKYVLGPVQGALHLLGCGFDFFGLLARLLRSFVCLEDELATSCNRVSRLSQLTSIRTVAVALAHRRRPMKQPGNAAPNAAQV